MDDTQQLHASQKRIEKKLGFAEDWANYRWVSKKSGYQNKQDKWYLQVYRVVFLYSRINTIDGSSVLYSLFVTQRTTENHRVPQKKLRDTLWFSVVLCVTKAIDYNFAVHYKQLFIFSWKTISPEFQISWNDYAIDSPGNFYTAVWHRRENCRRKQTKAPA